jgi:hypothetical protein
MIDFTLQKEAGLMHANMIRCALNSDGPKGRAEHALPWFSGVSGPR